MSKATKKFAKNALVRAVIYIRVSSERQAEGVSPQAQEDDARRYCEERGYTVVKVYRDTEKYKVGSKMVEPSGTRSDRPGLRQMLVDGAAGLFDVVVAWREDRLYRGVNRAMLDVSDLVKNGAVTIELVKEHYDPSTAVVKAWAAGVELQARVDRTIMGQADRLARGMYTGGKTVPYGLKVQDGYMVLDEEEAPWIEKIWRWRGEKAGYSEIRRRLVEGGARQRGNVKYPWQTETLRTILSHSYYHTGLFPVKWGGEVYELAVPVIVDPETAQRVYDYAAQWKAYPAGNLQAQALGAGLVYCGACNTRMGVHTWRIVRGEKVYTYFKYNCRNHVRRNIVEGCAGGVVLHRVDEQIWAKTWEHISDPVKFEADIQAAIAGRKAQTPDASAEVEKLQKRLDALQMGKQWVITERREKRITQDDYETQIASLYIEESAIKRDLAAASLLIGNQADKLMQVALVFRQELAAGWELLNCEPHNEEERNLQFEGRYKVVQGIVKRVDVATDKTVNVTLEYTPSNLCISDTPSSRSPNR
ncbi:MAG: recombinase family protein [Thermoflexales bacterium]|nr:recombinase family protein [Thermoflexales bacterium]